jgi:hypothetical protein
MKAGWQAILDSIARSLGAHSVHISSPRALMVIISAAIALFLLIKLLVNRAGIKISTRVSFNDQMAQSDGSPVAGAPDTHTVLFGIDGVSTKISVKEEPMVVRLKAGSLEKAQMLVATGKDMDSVCREIDPDYASWESLKQQKFQKAIAAVLKSQR